ncbi:MAG: hypothetical protein MUF87_19565 [Anaerolineae bacterium]|nr:hypothetical protein [Anaerolineae bacterium]
MIVFSLVNYPISAQTERDSIIEIGWDHQGRYLAIGKISGLVEIWDTPNNRLLTEITLTNPISAFAWSPDNNQLAIGSSHVTVWDIVTGERLLTLPEHVPGVADILWSPDGQTLLTTTYDPDHSPTLRKWDGETGELIATTSGSIGGLQWRWQHSQFFGTAGIFPAVYDGQTLELIRRLMLDDDFERDFQPTTRSIPSPDGQFAAIGYLNGWVRVWDVDQGTIVYQFQVHDGHPDRYQLLRIARVRALTFDGQFVTTITQDGTTRTWDLTTERFIQESHQETQLSFAQFSPYGGRLAMTAILGENQVSDLQIITPAPSIERLNRLREICITESDRGQVSIATPLNLGEFVTEVEATDPRGRVRYWSRPLSIVIRLAASIDAIV